jgi:SRSO17 transposase
VCLNCVGSRTSVLARTLFLKPLRHPARGRMCPLYVAGLIGPDGRKSLQPMAAQVAPADQDRLHHLVTVGPWHEAPLEAELLIQANQLVNGPDAILVVDDTALLKKGTHSVGVALQYTGVMGKQANHRALVLLTLAIDAVPIPIAFRLFLLDSWIKDPGRLQRAGVPEAFWPFSSFLSFHQAMRTILINLYAIDLHAIDVQWHRSLQLADFSGQARGRSGG